VRPATKALLKSLWQPRPRLNVWQWAEANVDFSRVPAYDTPLHGVYNADYIPQWKEVAECDTNLDIRECWVLKCSRAGGTENCVLNPIRYHVACEPMPILYTSGNQSAVEAFMEKRIKLGLQASMDTGRALREARAIEHRIDFKDMTLQVAWPSNKMAFKQDGWSRVYCDEYSLIKGANPQMLRKRTDTYQFSYIFGLSSMDPNRKGPSTDDPIYKEWAKGDCREWMCVDPETGNLFEFKMMPGDTERGLLWDKEAKREDGTWDLDRVRESAFFVTPDGTRITNDQRMNVVRTGKWIPTRSNAPSTIRSYRLTSFTLPFKSGDFGQIAVAFLEAKRQGPVALKAFLYEYLAEPWVEGEEKTVASELVARNGGYPKGTRFAEHEKFADIYIKKPSIIVVTADVQKGYHFQLARQWMANGDSGLIEWGRGFEMEDLLEFERDRHKADYVYIDGRYRTMEVCQAAAEFQWVPVFGTDRRISYPFQRKDNVDPYEGTSRAGDRSTLIFTYTFQDPIFKQMLHDLMRSNTQQAWWVHDGIDAEYIKQATSWRLVEGVWQNRPGHPADHLADCEKMQVLAAVIEGYYLSDWLQRLMAVASGIDAKEQETKNDE
jgi:hypothetical protein